VLTDGWLGVTAVTVAEEHRRRGLATAVMAALQRWAGERGAHSVYLQVTAGNAPARALYRRAGFIEHHRYHYRRRVG
jgi:ribosomal protein S18 acetylase RimI-like enzyme